MQTNVEKMLVQLGQANMNPPDSCLKGGEAVGVFSSLLNIVYIDDVKIGKF